MIQINLFGLLLIGAIGYIFGWFARKVYERRNINDNT